MQSQAFTYTKRTLDGILNNCIVCTKAGFFKAPEEAVLEMLVRGWTTIKEEWCESAGIKRRHPKGRVEQKEDFGKKDYQSGATPKHKIAKFLLGGEEGDEKQAN